MKTIKLITNVMFLFVALSLNATHGEPVSTDPLTEKPVKNLVFENSKVSFTTFGENQMEELAFVSYNESNHYFSLKTFKNIEFIQILNDKGELEFQLPINNSLMHISLDDFSEGTYTLNIDMENIDNPISTELVKK